MPGRNEAGISGRYAKPRQTLYAGFLDLIEFPKRFIDIPALLAQIGALFFHALHQQLELPGLPR